VDAENVTGAGGARSRERRIRYHPSVFSQPGTPRRQSFYLETGVERIALSCVDNDGKLSRRAATRTRRQMTRARAFLVRHARCVRRAHANGDPGIRDDVAPTIRDDAVDAEADVFRIARLGRQRCGRLLL
jgi:hypothetical protein